MANTPRKYQRSLSRLKEDILWGEYEKVWQDNHPLSPDLLDVYVNCLRGDLEKESDKISLCMAICGIYPYYTSYYVSVQNCLHLLTPKKAQDPNHVLGRLVCTNRLIDPKMPNVQPAPVGSWQRSSYFGLSTCEKCQPTILHPNAEIFSPLFSVGFFSQMNEQTVAAWRLFFSTYTLEHLQSLNNKFLPVDAYHLLQQFARMCLENQNQTSPYPQGSPFAISYPKEIYHPDNYLKWFDKAWQAAMQKSYGQISYQESSFVNPHFVRRIHAQIMQESVQEL